ncbi:hypothetical protein BDF19DRAFT_422246 [Syncephalis fuscata]|nr:hypothetical protein BDF19DRAFT_422246 [Syncephalis fuscata]
MYSGTRGRQNPPPTMFYYQSNLSFSNVHDTYNNDNVDTPHWDDVFTFRRHSSRAWSVITDNDAEEITTLLGNPIRGRLKRKLVEWCNRMLTRNILLIVVPTLAILAWCTIPIPYELIESNVPKPAPAPAPIEHNETPFKSMATSQPSFTNNQAQLKWSKHSDLPLNVAPVQVNNQVDNSETRYNIFTSVMSNHSKDSIKQRQQSTNTMDDSINQSSPLNVDRSTTTATIISSSNNSNNSIAAPHSLEFGKHEYEEHPPIALVNFWWFLFVYYGIYNIIALWLLTRIFQIYSLNWWATGWSSKSAGAACWLCSMVGGAFIHLFLPHLERYTITWVLLTFLMLTIPLLSAFAVIRGENRNVYRHSLTLTQQTFMTTDNIGPRIPASYFRFLWFCLVLVMMWATTVAGGFYAWSYLSSLPHTGIEAFIYVYSWVGIVYAIDFVCETIVEEKIRSHPLCTVFRLYFYLLYFIFYRNLFARLRNLEQFVLIQAASSIWVMIFYPLRMTRTTHRLLQRWFGVTRDYDDYQKMLGQLFYTRTIAENVTMLGFLCWMNAIRASSNFPIYPYYQFNGYEGDPYTYERTMICSIGVWVSELVTAYVTRGLFKAYFRHSITREAVMDMQRYPDTVLTLILVAIHVMQSMLLALFQLNFKH